MVLKIEMVKEPKKEVVFDFMVQLVVEPVIS